MAQETLGFIETSGLVAAIEAADQAAKAANVKIIGIELSRGKGMVTVKFSGNVSEVQAAVAAGVAAAQRVGQVISQLVIPRPYDKVRSMFAVNQALHEKKEAFPPENQDQGKVEDDFAVTVASVALDVMAEEKETGEEALKPQGNETTTRADEAGVAVEDEVGTGQCIGAIAESHMAADVKEGKEELAKEVCNLCGDPLCLRRKGEPRLRCLHYSEAQ